MCPNKVSQFFNVPILLAFSVRPDRTGITCMAHDFFRCKLLHFTITQKRFRLGLRLVYASSLELTNQDNTRSCLSSATQSPPTLKMANTCFKPGSTPTRKGGHFFIIPNDLIGCGIFNVDDDSWRFQWKI
jgi:hypothetical protein